MQYTWHQNFVKKPLQSYFLYPKYNFVLWSTWNCHRASHIFLFGPWSVLPLRIFLLSQFSNFENTFAQQWFMECSERTSRVLMAWGQGPKGSKGKALGEGQASSNPGNSMVLVLFLEVQEGSHWTTFCKHDHLSFE